MLKTKHILVLKHRIKIILPMYVSKVKDILNITSMMPQTTPHMNWRDLKSNSRSRLSAAAM